MAGPKQLQNLRVSALNANSSVAALHVHTVNSSGEYVSAGGGSTQVSVREILSSSGGSLIDSTNVSLGVTIRAGSAAGTEYTEGDIDATITGTAQLVEGASDTLRPVQGSTGTPSTGSFGVWMREVPSTRVQDVNLVAGQSTITTVSTGSVRVHQSTAADLQVTTTPVAGSTWNVRPLQSTYTDLNGLMRLADRDTSTNIAAILNAIPASTVYALAVREVGGGGSTQVSVSTGSVRVHQSTAADLNVTVAGYSTTVNVSSLAGAVVMRSSAADALHTAYQSTFTDLNCRVNAPSTANSSNFLPVRLTDGASYIAIGGDYTNGSTTSTLAGPALTYSNSSNDTMRLVGVAQPFPVQVRTGTLSFLSTTALITSTHSTAIYSLISSAAATRHKVTAYFVGSTHTNPSTLFFVSSNAQDLWAVNFGSGSSGITGANAAKTAPDFFFGTESAAALQVRIEGGNSTAASTTIARVSISYFSEA